MLDSNKSIDRILFQADRADGRRFRKLRDIRYFLWGALLLFGAFVDYMGFRIIEVPVLELLNIPKLPYFLCIVVLAIATISVHYFSTVFVRFGFLKVYRDRLEFSDGTVETIRSFSEIDKIQIIRGATFHYEYQKDNKLVKINNFFKYLYHGQEEEIEFCMNSEDHNKQFELMLRELKVVGIRFLYKSI